MTFDPDNEKGMSSLQRAFKLLRAVLDSDDGARLNRLAQQTGMTQPTAHRLLHALIDEGMVEQDAAKAYRPTLSLFAMAAKSARRGNLRDVCRPILLRMSATLSDTTFLIVRNGYDAICLDRCEGALPIRSFTGDIGGRVVLGTGQASLTILAFLPEAEREEVIRFNLPRLLDAKLHDEVSLRLAIDWVREQGYAVSRGIGSFPGDGGVNSFPGMAGIAVPILDRDGRALAALSIGTLAERLNTQRLPTVVSILQREAAALTRQLDPFDPSSRRPAQVLGSALSERMNSP